MNYNWNWGIFFEMSPEGTGTYLDMILSGLVWTILSAFASFALAMVLGSIVGVMRTLPSRWAQRFGSAWVELFRNIPLLVQMFLWYFVIPDILPAPIGPWLKQLPDSSFWTAVISLGLFTSARIAEQVRAGVRSMSRGQQMAALALGLRLGQTYRYVLLPMAYRIIMPPLTSEFLNNLKNTSVALTIGLAELTGRSRSMQEFSFQIFEAFTAATVLYLVINVIVVFIAQRIERKIAVPGFISGGR